jgi:hypothetical protein
LNRPSAACSVRKRPADVVEVADEHAPALLGGHLDRLLATEVLRDLLDAQGLRMAPRPTITPSQPVSSTIRTAEGMSTMSPFASTGMRSRAFVSAILSTARSPE